MDCSSSSLAIATVSIESRYCSTGSMDSTTSALCSMDCSSSSLSALLLKGSTGVFRMECWARFAFISFSNSASFLRSATSFILRSISSLVLRFFSPLLLILGRGCFFLMLFVSGNSRSNATFPNRDFGLETILSSGASLLPLLSWSSSALSWVLSMRRSLDLALLEDFLLLADDFRLLLSVTSTSGVLDRLFLVGVLGWLLLVGVAIRLLPLE